jgi:sporulation protein YlmC with PRC-barrel domain
MEAGERSSWEALQPGTPVVSSDGQEIGTVKEVIAAAEQDIFEGVIFEGPQGERYADEEIIGDIYDHAVELKIDAAAAAQLAAPSPAPAAMEVGVDDVSEKSGPYKRELFFKRWWNRLTGNY